MTILHLIETGGPGGAENVLINLAANLDDKRFKSIVLLCKEGWLYDELVRRGIETYIFEESGFFDFAFLTRFVFLVRNKKISVIHAHEFLMSMYASVAGLLTSKPVVTTMHGKYYYWEKARRRLIMRFISRFSHMVSVSKELRSFISEKVGISPERIQTIYNGIDLKKYTCHKPNGEIRLQLRLNGKCKVITTVGNLYPVKGHIYLLKAIPEVIRRYPDVVFLFAGRGDEENNLKQAASELGVSDNIRFLGFRSDIPELLSLTDIFVLPSLAESLPLSVLEALAMGIPSIVTNVGGNSEIIENNTTGFIVPPADSKSIAEKILILLQDEKQVASFRKKARDIIGKTFSLETMVNQYDSLYNRVNRNTA